MAGLGRVPLAAGERSVAVMVDPERSNLAREQSPRDVYEAEMAKTRRLRALLQDSTLIHGPRGWDASMYLARACAADRWLLVGDAASSIDPLSSAGVKKAPASGWLAAIVAHTCLVRPSMQATALAFYQQRESEVYEAFRDLTQRYFSRRLSGTTTPSGATGALILRSASIGRSSTVRCSSCARLNRSDWRARRSSRFARCPRSGAVKSCLNGAF